MKPWNYKEYRTNLSQLELKHAPQNLYWEGNLSLLSEGIRVSVVGSRSASKEGLMRAEIITNALTARDIVVVSGLAEGIDTVAHNTAIKNGGKTIAVLGTPLNVAYPKSNAQLLETIKKDHLAISQFSDGHPFAKQNFPRRNRTMALISDATIIIEATEDSGTKHQGWEALRLGRIVFILKNVAEDPNLSWPKEMIQYGAQVLTRENMGETLDNIPGFTSTVDCAY